MAFFTVWRVAFYRAQLVASPQADCTHRVGKGAMTEVTYTQHLKKLSSVAAGFTAYVVATDRIKCPVGYQADYVFLKNS